MGNTDVENLLEPFLNFSELQIKTGTTLISTRSGEAITESSLSGVLRHAITDILSEPLRWDKVLQKLVADLENRETCLLTVGPVRAADALARELSNKRSKTLTRVEIRPEKKVKAQVKSGDIAIVGVAGRIPGAETLEEAWKVLEGGNDLHKKVSDTIEAVASS